METTELRIASRWRVVSALALLALVGVMTAVVGPLDAPPTADAVPTPSAGSAPSDEVAAREVPPSVVADLAAHDAADFDRLLAARSPGAEVEWYGFLYSYEVPRSWSRSAVAFWSALGARSEPLRCARLEAAFGGYHVRCDVAVTDRVLDLVGATSLVVYDQVVHAGLITRSGFSEPAPLTAIVAGLDRPVRDRRLLVLGLAEWTASAEPDAYRRACGQNRPWVAGAACAEVLLGEAPRWLVGRR